ncbi:MAG: 3'-5' exonuclease [Bdellovibrionota bacterium]
MTDREQIVLIFDVETTGLNPSRDQVIEFAFQKGLGDDAFRKSWRFKPTVPISSFATMVHGITNEDVAGCPPFASAIETIQKIFAGSDVIVGYNVSFDIEMVQNEFRRAGVEGPDLRGKQIIDPHRLWSKCEPRRLEDAVRRFAGREHTNAHSALADVQATGEALVGMLKAFSMHDASWEGLADFIDPGRKERIGDTNHISWREGVVIFGFGKHKGRSVFEVIQEDRSYSSWVLGRDFPDHVKTIVSKAGELAEPDFHVWIQSAFR